MRWSTLLPNRPGTLLLAVALAVAVLGLSDVRTGSGLYRRQDVFVSGSISSATAVWVPVELDDPIETLAEMLDPGLSGR